MLDELIQKAAQYFLDNEIDPDDTELGSQVMDARWSWSAVVEESDLSTEQVLELCRELQERYGQIGEMQGEGDTIISLIHNALLELPEDSPVIQQVIVQIELTDVNHAEEVARRLKKYNLTTV